MHPPTTPLTLDVALTSWRLDTVTTVVAVVVLAAYVLAWRRASSRGGSSVPRSAVVVFGVLGIGVWLVAGVSVVGVYADTLFWVRALQFVLLLLVAPFGLALGRPVTVLRESLGDLGRTRFDAALTGRAARLLLGPIPTSALMLAVPWLIYFSGWYELILRDASVNVATRLLLVIIGVGYFYARLQVDPVPRRYPQALSLGITTAESIADGLLGIVLWQGSLVAVDYYTSLHRTWGPSLRTDQTIGAGVLWILGDVVGLPFLMVLFRRFRSDERETEKEVDAALASGAQLPAHDPAETGSGLWWESDPNLRDRYR